MPRLWLGLWAVGLAAATGATLAASATGGIPHRHASTAARYEHSPPPERKRARPPPGPATGTPAALPPTTTTTTLTLPPATTTTTAPPPSDATSTATPDWACIRFHESSDGYQMGGGGAYQFEDGTWTAVTGLPGPAQNYPPATQDQAALALYAARGFEPWSTAPGCGL